MDLQAEIAHSNNVAYTETNAHCKFALDATMSETMERLAQCYP